MPLKRVLPEGATLKGYCVPGGNKVGYNVWVLQWDPIYGADVQMFWPERWIDSDQETVMRMKVLGLLLWCGRWRSLGKRIAFVEVSEVLVGVSFTVPRGVFRAEVWCSCWCVLSSQWWVREGLGGVLVGDILCRIGCGFRLRNEIGEKSDGIRVCI